VVRKIDACQTTNHGRLCPVVKVMWIPVIGGRHGSYE